MNVKTGLLKRYKILRTEDVLIIIQYEELIDNEPDEIKKQKLQLQIERIKSNWAEEDKAVEDLKQKLTHTIERLQQLPQYTQKDFKVIEAQIQKGELNPPTELLTVLMNNGEILKNSERPQFKFTDDLVTQIQDFLR